MIVQSRESFDSDTRGAGAPRHTPTLAVLAPEAAAPLPSETAGDFSVPCGADRSIASGAPSHQADDGGKGLTLLGLRRMCRRGAAKGAASEMATTTDFISSGSRDGAKSAEAAQKGWKRCGARTLAVAPLGFMLTIRRKAANVLKALRAGCASAPSISA
jgi:hypothetical protein